MYLEYITSRPGIGKIAIIVFGLIILILGLISHFDSGWRAVNKPISICQVLKKSTELGDSSAGSCPPFEMEEYYISTIIICFILSIGNFLVSIMIDTSKGIGVYVDLGYHILAALSLFIAGAVYIASAAQIRKIEKSFGILGAVVNLRGGEKIAAGVLTIIHALLYGAVGFLIISGDKRATHPF